MNRREITETFKFSKRKKEPYTYQRSKPKAFPFRSMNTRGNHIGISRDDISHTHKFARCLRYGMVSQKEHKTKKKKRTHTHTNKPNTTQVLVFTLFSTFFLFFSFSSPFQIFFFGHASSSDVSLSKVSHTHTHSSKQTHTHTLLHSSNRWFFGKSTLSVLIK